MIEELNPFAAAVRLSSLINELVTLIRSLHLSSALVFVVPSRFELETFPIFIGTLEAVLSALRTVTSHSLL